jgi:hypothetical protein
MRNLTKKIGHFDFVIYDIFSDRDQPKRDIDDEIKGSIRDWRKGNEIVMITREFENIQQTLGSGLDRFSDVIV